MSIHFDQDALREPAARRDILKTIRPDREVARQSRRTLLLILAEETRYRENDDDNDDDFEYFENMYWCAFLLYLAGDPRDVPAIWKAKRINMDTNAGLDGQCLVGAGVDLTIRFLEENNEREIAAYIRGMRKCGDFDMMTEWEDWRAQYFYGESAK